MNEICKECSFKSGSDTQINYGFTAAGNRIADAVIDVTGFTWFEIIQRNRERPLIGYRQACMYLVKKYTSMSLGAIGNAFNACGQGDA